MNEVLKTINNLIATADPSRYDNISYNKYYRDLTTISDKVIDSIEKPLKDEMCVKNFSSYDFWDVSTQLEILLSQYKKHGQLIIAVDFDDTIHDSHQRKVDFSPIHSLLKRAVDINCKLMIFTARADWELAYVASHCEKVDLKYEVINDDVLILPSGKSRKPYFNLLLDDKAGLMEAFLILTRFVETIENQKKENV